MEEVSQKFPNLTQQVIPIISLPSFLQLIFFLIKYDKVLIQNAKKHIETETLQHVCSNVIAGCWLHS